MQSTYSTVFLNGRLLHKDEALISPEDRGFLLGDGVFDTLRISNGSIFRFASHYERLAENLKVHRIEAPFDKTGLADHFAELIRANKISDAVVRVTVTRGPGEGGYRRRQNETPTVYISARPLPDLETLRREGMAATISPIPRPLGVPAITKTISAGAFALARLMAEPNEAILLSSDGTIAEGASSSFYAIFDDKIYTPPADQSLRSVSREIISELCPVEERKMKIADIRNADGAFLSSISMGPASLQAIDDIHFQCPHPLALKLAEKYETLIQRETTDSSG